MSFPVFAELTDEQKQILSAYRMGQALDQLTASGQGDHNLLKLCHCEHGCAVTRITAPTEWLRDHKELITSFAESQGMSMTVRGGSGPKATVLFSGAEDVRARAKEALETANDAVSWGIL